MNWVMINSLKKQEGNIFADILYLQHGIDKTGLVYLKRWNGQQRNVFAHIVIVINLV
jgi:hypothetical protein